jgi:hypothetical protein
MKIDASNLGQIIGRLQYGELEPATPVPEVAAAAKPRRAFRAHSGVPKRIVELLAKHPEGLRVRVICASLGLETTPVSAYLCQMADIERTGPRGQYVYKLKGPDA